jgi:biopolymer transport protein TolR
LMGPSSSSNDDNFHAMAEINIIPLVDIMLVLLIIFMVAAPLSMSGIDVKLPASGVTGGSVDESRMVLSIDEKGDYFIGKDNIRAIDLEGKLAAIFDVRVKKEMYIRADKRVVYGAVMAAMSSAKLAGVQKISMLTHPKSNASGSKSGR